VFRHTGTLKIIKRALLRSWCLLIKFTP
jgi:hypothetical protein